LIPVAPTFLTRTCLAGNTVAKGVAALFGCPVGGELAGLWPPITQAGERTGAIANAVTKAARSNTCTDSWQV
jgi:hypothetical protein